MSMQVFTWILLILFIGVMLLIGKLGSKSASTMAGFAIAKGSVKPWWLGICFGATYASANLFIGVPGWAYSYGECVLWWTWGCFGLSWLGIIFLARKFWKFGQEAGGAISLADWLGIRYNSQALRLGVAVMGLFSIYYILGQNVGIATLFESMLGVPYAWGLALATVIIIIYIGVGGAFADIVTDTIQGILMMIFGTIVFLSLMWTIGGGLGFLGKLHSELNAISPVLTAPLNPESPNFSDVFGLVGIMLLLLGFVLLPALINKVLALESEKDLREFLWSSGICLFIMSNTMVFAGLAGRVILPPLEFADSVVPQYIAVAFPPIVAGLIVVTVLSAVLSTTDGLYVAISTMLASDIYGKILAPIMHKNTPKEVIERRTVVLSKALIPVIGVVAFILALNRPASLTLLTQIGNSGIISGVAAAIVLGYFWRRANRTGAIASFICGTGGYIFLLLSGIQPNVFKALVIASALGFTAMIIVSLMTPPMPEEFTNRFLGEPKDAKGKVGIKA